MAGGRLTELSQRSASYSGIAPSGFSVVHGVAHKTFASRDGTDGLATLGGPSAESASVHSNYLQNQYIGTQ